MRISEAISESTPLAVPFAMGAVLNIEYRPASTTLAAMEDMAETAREAEESEAEGKGSTPDEVAQMKARIANIKNRLIGTIKDTVVSWDLTEDDGETIVPIDDVSLSRVPMNIFIEITKEIRRHQSAGDSGKA